MEFKNFMQLTLQFLYESYVFLLHVIPCRFPGDDASKPPLGDIIHKTYMLRKPEVTMGRLIQIS